MELAATYSEEEEKKLPLLLVFAGVDHLQEPVQRPGGIRYFQISYCISGSGEVFLGGRRCIISEGQGIFLTPDTPHAYHALQPGWKTDYLLFTGTLCSSILNSLGMTESNIFSYTDPEAFHRQVIGIRDLYLSECSHKSRMFCKMLFSMLVDISFGMNRMETKAFEKTDDTIMRIIDYMEQNYMRDISLDDIAEHIGLSKEHLCRIFKENLHVTIIEDLNRIRVFHSARMLVQHPDKTAHEIGMECGFSSPSYFGKVFKKLEGMTPNMYRLKNGR